VDSSAISTSEAGTAEPCSVDARPGMPPAVSIGTTSEEDEQFQVDDVPAAPGAAHDETALQVSDQDNVTDIRDDSQSPMSVAERSVQALAVAGELVAGLIAATVSISRPSAGTGTVENISVEMPEPTEGGPVTSSEENSPQLVDVLRQSALHDRYRHIDCGNRRFSLEPPVVHDSDMVDVLQDSTSLDLDDSWVTVEGSLSEGHASPTELDQNRSSLEAARGFLRRHLLHRLRPSSGGGQT
jgi:hypothetical protein